MARLIIKNAKLVNENKTYEGDLAIKGQFIDEINSCITVKDNDTVMDADGALLLPGMIDDQVHFREPGLTHKGSIATESRAAVAGGITSYMEMPNVSPSTTTIDALKAKHAIAANSSMANYSFYLGATPDNLNEIKAVDPSWVCGVKVFMGASTGDLLVEHPQALDAIFKECPTLIATHCEKGDVIAANLAKVRSQKQILTPSDHPVIRDAEACYQSSSYAVGLAKKHSSKLHVLHLTTAKEMELFDVGPIESKLITAEACVHHLWFNQGDYAEKGNMIKCNPAIKSEEDRQALIKAINEDRIDIIATDHAPHTWEEKSVPFESAPAGLPLVQHALLSALEHVYQGTFTLERVVQKLAHNPAIRYGVEKRGFLREGYFADLVLVSDTQYQTVTKGNTLYHCGWTPFEGTTFHHKILSTFVNGHQVFDGENVVENTDAMALSFQN